LALSLPSRKYFFVEISSIELKSGNPGGNISSLCELGVNQENNPWTIRGIKEVPTNLDIADRGKWDMQKTEKKIPSPNPIPAQKPQPNRNGVIQSLHTIGR
jgi:hypothetical protein